MNKEARMRVCNNVRKELSKGIHTYTMCKCGRHGSRGVKCWECLLEMIESGKEDYY